MDPDPYRNSAKSKFVIVKKICNMEIINTTLDFILLSPSPSEKVKFDR